MALFEGETKFSVVHVAIERIDVVQLKLIYKYSEMKLSTDKVNDKMYKMILIQFVNDLEREFKVMKKYNTFLTSFRIGTLPGEAAKPPLFYC